MMPSRWLVMALLISSVGHAQKRSSFYDLIAEEPPKANLEQVKATVVAPVAQEQAPTQKLSKFRNLLSDTPVKEAVAASTEQPKQPIQITIMDVPKPQIMTADLPSVISCEQNGKNQCENIHYDIGTLNRPGYTAEFIKHMLPIALYMQMKTGFPAAVMIAQSIQETGSGNSGHARIYNGLFGHTCGRLGTPSNISFVAQNESFSSKGTCSVRAYDPQTGKTVNYVRFNTPESSVAGYIHNVLHDTATRGAYGTIRKEVESVRAKDPNAVASWQKVVAGLDRYAEDQSYRSKLTAIIRNNGLDKLDKSSCQTCIEQREMNKRKSNEAPATASLDILRSLASSNSIKLEECSIGTKQALENNAPAVKIAEKLWQMRAQITSVRCAKWTENNQAFHIALHNFKNIDDSETALLSLYGGSVSAQTAPLGSYENLLGKGIISLKNNNKMMSLVFEDLNQDNRPEVILLTNMGRSGALFAFQLNLGKKASETSLEIIEYKEEVEDEASDFVAIDAKNTRSVEFEKTSAGTIIKTPNSRFSVKKDQWIKEAI